MNSSEEMLKKDVDKIKANVIATIIMEITRRLDEDKKKIVQAFCDKMIFYKKKQEVQEKWEQIIPDLMHYHHTNYNPMRVASVKDIPWSREHQEKLLHMYNQATEQFDCLQDTEGMKKEKSRTFEDFYLGQLKSVYDRKDKFNKQLEIRN